MASSISAMSSGGPSSPNYSDLFSRGCPSSDMSASITSTDGLAAGGGSHRDDLPQVFPIIDNDLNVLGSHFNYDQLAASISLDSPVRIPPVSKDATLDISGDLTPISTCSDWEFNTNDATKGSTNTNCDLTAEEDDEDATISTDTCLSTGDLAVASEEAGRASNPNLTLASTAIAGSKQLQKELLFDLKNVRHELIHLRSDIPAPPASAPPTGPNSAASGGATSKIDNRFRGNRIQKQISLYEKDSRTEAKNLSQESHKFGDRSSGMLKHATSYDHQPSRIHMSFDELQKDIPNLERNLASKFELEQEKCSKTNKCMAARLNNASTPGALLIRESFIEPPRITRVTKSFHGKTDYHHLQQVNDVTRRASDIVRPSTSISVLLPTVANQTCAGRDCATNRYNKNQIRQEASGGSAPAGTTGTRIGAGRFTTSIVPETSSNAAAAREENTVPAETIEDTVQSREEIGDVGSLNGATSRAAEDDQARQDPAKQQQQFH